MSVPELSFISPRIRDALAAIHQHAFELIVHGASLQAVLDVRVTYFQATAATLIYGVRDAVLVDAFMTVTQANALADWVGARGKNLTTIYITHGHGDHWFGVGTLLERFPHAKAVATPNAVKVMRQNASPEALEGIWKPAFPDQIPDRLVIAEELEGNDTISAGRQQRSVNGPP